MSFERHPKLALPLLYLIALLSTVCFLQKRWLGNSKTRFTRFILWAAITFHGASFWPIRSADKIYNGTPPNPSMSRMSEQR
jgi:hypothetical protein